MAVNCITVSRNKSLSKGADYLGHLGSAHHRCKGPTWQHSMDPLAFPKPLLTTCLKELKSGYIFSKAAIWARAPKDQSFLYKINLLFFFWRSCVACFVLSSRSCYLGREARHLSILYPKLYSPKSIKRRPAPHHCSQSIQISSAKDGASTLTFLKTLLFLWSNKS
jgi:hypothetical protein